MTVQSLICIFAACSYSLFFSTQSRFELRGGWCWAPLAFSFFLSLSLLRSLFPLSALPPPCPPGHPCTSLSDHANKTNLTAVRARAASTLQVVLWLRETMRHDRFMAELSLRPKAVNVYSCYLKDTRRWDMLERFFVEVRQAELARWGQVSACSRWRWRWWSGPEG